MTKHIFRVPVDTQHFHDTIEIGKPYAELLPFLPAEEQLKKIAQGGTIRYWGSLPGESNKRTFHRLTQGDELLCYRSGNYVALATIAFSLINPALARYSWGETKNKTTWELIYFFSEVKLIDVKATVISQELGYKSGLVMGFSMVEEQTAHSFLAKHTSLARFLGKLRA